MEFIKAKEEHVGKIMEIIASAQAFLKSNGVVQWQNGYPTTEKILQDIANGYGHIACENGEILGYFVMFVGYEPDYFEGCFLNADGAWKTDFEYAVVHRVAVGVKGKGLGSAIFDYAMQTAKQNGAKAMRIDTHRHNIPMQTVLKKHGFEYCGIINVSEGERFAFEVVL
ncbi:MAG: GNAT family N-acetyltransferase [Bacillota bacterium]